MAFLSTSTTQMVAVAAVIVLAPVVLNRLTRKYFKAQSSGVIIISGASTGIGR